MDHREPPPPPRPTAGPDEVAGADPTYAPSREGVAPMRRWMRNPRQHRVRLQVRRDQLCHDLRGLDEQIDELTKRRLDIIHGLDECREALWPTVPHRRGRRPPDAETPPLPPAQPDALPAIGRSLRAICRAILRKHGPLPLPALHTWIHHYGYELWSAQPTKALADAMGYEVMRHRVVRVERGVYAIDPDAPRSRWRSDREPDLTDPPVANDQPSRGPRGSWGW